MTLEIERLDQIQAYMKEKHIDCWLIYDTRGETAFFQKYFPNFHRTRQIILAIQQEGNPKGIVSAVEAGHIALELARDNRSYYEEQLEKFRKARGF